MFEGVKRWLCLLDVCVFVCVTETAELSELMQLPSAVGMAAVAGVIMLRRWRSEDHVKTHREYLERVHSQALTFYHNNTGNSPLL